MTSGDPEDKRKSIVDGMLFEIFFDKDGKLRKRIKTRYLDEIFELQQYEELKPSFDFIADALTATGGDFHAVPGKGHEPGPDPPFAAAQRYARCRWKTGPRRIRSVTSAAWPKATSQGGRQEQEDSPVRGVMHVTGAMW
jgi:hypothetical protein